MTRALNFAKRNFIEMIRDPFIYIFCLCFPAVMLILFVVINSFVSNGVSTFELKSLVPGIIMFSFAFVMLLESMLVSKDRYGAFLNRLFTSPMKSTDFIIGYSAPCLIIGILQIIMSIVCGFILSLITGVQYFGFGKTLLLMVEMIPILIMFIFLGILFGTVLNDKSAPGICSVIISASGILGGAWMPLETMGSFQTFCRFLPFYPAVYIGRIITGAEYFAFENGIYSEILYTFNITAKLGLITIFAYLVVIMAMSVMLFKKNMTSNK